MSAVSWTTASIPRAMPLTRTTPLLAKAVAISRAVRMPYPVGFRVPTIEIDGSQSRPGLPMQNSVGGGSRSSISCSGYQGVSRSMSSISKARALEVVVGCDNEPCEFTTVSTSPCGGYTLLYALQPKAMVLLPLRPRLQGFASSLAARSTTMRANHRDLSDLLR